MGIFILMKTYVDCKKYKIVQNLYAKIYKINMLLIYICYNI